MDTETVLAHFRQVLCDLHAESERNGPELGAPPAWLIVEQRTPSSHASFNTGSTLRRWRVSTDSTVDMAVGERLPSQNRAGMYYDWGRADFSVRENDAKVRIGWQVGPRYGRGYDLPLEIADRGAPRLGIPIPLWVS